MRVGFVVQNCLKLPTSAIDDAIRIAKQKLDEWDRREARVARYSALLSSSQKRKFEEAYLRETADLTMRLHVLNLLKRSLSFRKPKGRRPHSWDYEVDFDEMKSVLLSDLELLLRFPHCFGEKCRKRVFHHLSVAVLSLLNGLRVSEAIEAFWRAVAGDFERSSSNLHRVHVRVRKKRREEFRDAYIHPLVLKGIKDLGITKDLNLTRQSVSVFLSRNYGVNPHSLRYSFVGAMVKRGVPLPVVCRVLHHSKLDFVLHYTSARYGEEALEEFIREVV